MKEQIQQIDTAHFFFLQRQRLKNKDEHKLRNTKLPKNCLQSK